MDAVMARMKLTGRITLCGMISDYNDRDRYLGDFGKVLARRLQVRGFIVTDFLPQWSEATEQLISWVMEGKLKHRETIIDGLEQAPIALNRLFTGDKMGKLMIRVTQSE